MDDKLNDMVFRGQLRKELYSSAIKYITRPYLQAGRKELPYHF